MISYLDSFIEDHMLNIVMEIAEGGDLSQRIKACKEGHHAMSESAIWQYIIQMCQVNAQSSC